MIEAKWSDSAKSANFSFFEKYIKGIKKIQIVKELQREKTYPDGTEIRAAKNWLSEINLE
jgi:hypothetical protein